jgi:gliding motility-associated-like protein
MRQLLICLFFAFYAKAIAAPPAPTVHAASHAFATPKLDTKPSFVKAAASPQGQVIKIMPLGDSNTEGGSSAIKLENRAGYRDKLEELLNASNFKGIYDFVGSERTGSALMNDTDHAGFGGARDEDIAALLANGEYSHYGEYMRGPGGGPYLDKYQPDVILLHIGTNQVDGSANAMNDVKKILDQVDLYEQRAKKEVTVIVARIIKRVCYTDAGGKYQCPTPTEAENTLKYNNMLETYVKQRIAAGDKLELVDMQDGAKIVYKYSEDGGDMADHLHPDKKGYDKMAAVWFKALEEVIQLDTQAPDAPVVVAPGHGAVLATSKPAISGTAEAGSTVTVIIDGAVVGKVTAAANGNWTLSTASALADGTHTVSAKASDAAGNSSPNSKTNTFIVDTSTPDTKIEVAPAALTNSKTSRFDFSSTSENVTYEAKLDGAASYATVEDPLTLSNLSDGEHTIRVRAKSQAGITDPTPAQHTWVIDTKAPAAPVVKTPADGARLNNAKPAIAGTAEAGSVVTVTLDGAVLGKVTATANGEWSLAPVSALKEGAHQLTAKASDKAGNTSPASSAITFTIDTEAPDTKIISGPDALANKKSATFEFGSTKPKVSYAARLDGALFAPVSNPYTVTNLSDGEHRLEVRATDETGNTDPTPAIYTWRVDTKAPAAPVVSAPAEGALLSNSKPTLTGTAESGSTVDLYMGAAKIGTVTAASNGKWSFTPGSTLAEGEQQLTAKATDAAGNSGNASSIRKFTIDTKAPETTIASKPAAVTNSSEAKFRFQSNETGVIYQVSLDGGAFAEAPATYTASGLAEGTHSLAVRATDAAGNTDASPATYNWQVDTKAPAAPVFTSISEDRGPKNDDQITADDKLKLSGKAEASAVVAVLNNGAAIGETKANATGTWEVSYENTALAAGTHAFTATATDAAGNTSATSKAFNVMVELTAPKVTLAAEGKTAVKEAFTVSIRFTEEVYGLTAADFEVTNGSITNVASSDQTSFTAVVTPATDGVVQVKLPAGNVADLAGNLNEASNLLETRYDATRPKVTLRADASAAVNAPFTITFSFDEAVSGFDLADIALTNAEAGDFTAVNARTYTARIAPGTEGEVSVRIAADKAFDEARNGNQASATLKRLYDTQRPSVTLQTKAPDPTNAPFTVSISFSEKVESFDAPDLNLTNASASQLKQVEENLYTVLITPKANGEVTVGMAANAVQDIATNGNQPANTLSLVYDAGRPAVTLSTDAPVLTNMPFTVTFSISEAITGFDLSDIKLANAIAENLKKVSEQVYTALIKPTDEGQVLVSVPASKVYDAASNGNTASNLLELAYDATAPQGYAVRFGTEKVDVTNQKQISLDITGAEKGATYIYTIRSSNGGEEVTGTAVVSAAAFTVSGLDLSDLKDGLLTATLYLTDEAGNKGAEVTAQVEKLIKDIAEVSGLPDISVPFKTDFTDVPLPEKVVVTYTNGEKAQLSIAWERGSYNGGVPARYILTGTLELQENTSNTTNKTARVTVTVEPNQPPISLTLSETNFRPDIESKDTIGTFSTSDPDDNEFTYALVSGQGDTDNNLFEINSTNGLYLISNKGLSGKSSFSIRVRSTDPYQNTIEKSFTLTKTLYQPQNKIKLVNAFSPDGDGVNDTWQVPELRYYNQVEVEVYDRAGVRLFHTSDPEKGWDGRGTDGRLLQGAFFYIIQVKDINLVQKGVVTVLK